MLEKYDDKYIVKEAFTTMSGNYVRAINSDVIHKNFQNWKTGDEIEVYGYNGMGWPDMIKTNGKVTYKKTKENE